MKWTSHIVLLILLCFQGNVIAQLNEPLNHDFNRELNRFLESPDSRFHTAIKPYNSIEVEEYVRKDSLFNLKGFDGYFNNVANGSIISVKNEKFSLAINPLFSVDFGYDSKEKSVIYETDIGAQLEATLWNKIGIGFNYRKYYGDPSLYVRDRVLERKMIPGYGKVDDFTANTFSAQEFDGYISIVPNEHVALEGGFGKHFWGEGYRSFFLSDNATSYPYFKFTANFWRIKYVYLYSVLKYGNYEYKKGDDFDLETPNTKYNVTHYLSVDVAKWFQFGFFEGVVWKRADSTGVRGVEWNYLNPVVFIRPVEFALGSPDNVILGMNFKFKMGPKNQLYTQIVLDDLDIGKAREGSGFYRTKVAWQIGLKSFDLFKLEHLDVQTEYNLVRPYTFAHKTPEQNYAHYSQALTHPSGANFWEWLIFIDYRKNRWIASMDFQWMRQGIDNLDDPNNNHNGSNIFISDYEIVDGIRENLDFAYGNQFLQGILRDLTSVRLSGGYLLNPHLNMKIEAYFQHRVDNIPEIDVSVKNTQFGISFKTDLFNKYNDF